MLNLYKEFSEEYHPDRINWTFFNVVKKVNADAANKIWFSNTEGNLDIVRSGVMTAPYGEGSIKKKVKYKINDI